jgi:hypothetical protein
MEPETLMTWSMGGATLPPDSEPQESTHFTVAEPESLRARDVPEDIEDFDDNESVS